MKFGISEKHGTDGNEAHPNDVTESGEDDAETEIKEDRYGMFIEQCEEREQVWANESSAMSSSDKGMEKKGRRIIVYLVNVFSQQCFYTRSCAVNRCGF